MSVKAISNDIYSSLPSQVFPLINMNIISAVTTHLSQCIHSLEFCVNVIDRSPLEWSLSAVPPAARRRNNPFWVWMFWIFFYAFPYKSDIQSLQLSCQPLFVVINTHLFGWLNKLWSSNPLNCQNCNRKLSVINQKYIFRRFSPAKSDYLIFYGQF